MQGPLRAAAAAMGLAAAALLGACASEPTVQAQAQDPNEQVCVRETKVGTTVLQTRCRTRAEAAREAEVARSVADDVRKAPMPKVGSGG